MNLKPSGPALLAAIFGFAGLTLLVVGIVTNVQEYSFGRRATAVEGTVVALERRSGKSGSLYAPIVEYLARDKVARFTSSVASSPPDFKVGDRVEVLYDPARPDQATINSFGQRWLTGLVLLAMGLIFAGVGIGVGLSSRRRR